MSDTPQPNDADMETAGKIQAACNGFSNSPQVILLIASYRHQIESKHLDAIKACKEALDEDALWCFNQEPPFSLKAEYNNGTGSLTSGPNNCRRFFNAKNNALAKLKELGL